MSERTEFGAALRRERERRGIDLETVADSTKIGLALLAGLERGDLSRWPSGIFRRAFIRAYASAIGLPPDDVAARLELVLPDRSENGVVSVPPFERTPSPADPLRLTLASAPRQTTRAWLMRGAAVAVDVATVAACGFAVSWASHQPVELVTLVVGGVYFVTGTLLFESSPAVWALRRLQRARPASVVRDADSVTPWAGEDVEPRRTDAPAARAGHRDRRPGRPERRRVPRSAQRSQ